jgi:hypothetical protein
MKSLEQLTLTFSQEASHSHASHFQRPGSEEARKIQDIYGLRCLESFKKLSPDGLWQKTFSGLLIGMKDWYSNKCYLTWKLRGTKHRRSYFRLVPSTPRTDGIGSGLSDIMLKTPSAVETEGGVMEIRQGANAHYKLRDQIAMLPALLHTPRAVMPEETPENFRARMNSKRANDRKDGLPNLAVQIAMLPTPQARDSKNPNTSETPRIKRKLEQGWTIDLNDKIAMLPTPKSRDWKGGATKARDTLDNKIEMGATKGMTGTQTGLKLQPNFVEWMMGYPQNWTDLNYQNQDIGWKD